MKTPVWFVEQDGVLYVRTINDSGKVKRIRNNGQVRIVPCKSQGEPVGEWIGAHAELVNSSETEQVTRLLKRKYGLMKSMFDLLGRPSKAEPATIAIRF